MDRKKDAFDRTLAKHVRETMSGHKKVKKHKTHISRRIDMSGSETLMSTLERAEDERDDRHEIHAMLNKGMETLFPDTKAERDALVIGEDNDDDLNIRALQYKCNMRIMDMDMDDIDDLIYILDLFNESTGAWYWRKCEHDMELAMNARLRVLEAEENDDE
jgi:hypothetical protein